MRYSSRVDRIAGGSVRAWDVHIAAREANLRGEDRILLSELRSSSARYSMASRSTPPPMQRFGDPTQKLHHRNFRDIGLRLRNC